jgi:hypothetical protein
VATILPLAGVILERSALAAGFLAAMIAVGGFIARAQALLGGTGQDDLQHPTTIGGLSGFCFGVLIIAIDMMVG